MPFDFRAFPGREFLQSGREQPALFYSVQEYGIPVGTFDDLIRLSGLEVDLEATMIKGQQSWILNGQYVVARVKADLVHRFGR